MTQWIRDISLNVYAGGIKSTIEGLRIQFNVVMTDRRTPNTAEVRVYNLNRDTRNLFAERFQVIELFAGYTGASRMIFTGNVTNVFSEKEGPDWITTIYAADGFKALNNSYLSKTYKPGVTIRQIVQDLAGAVSLSVVYRDEEGLLNTQYRKSVSVSGPVGKSLRKILRRIDFRASAQHGVLEVYPKNSPIRGAVEERLTPDTGLLDVPIVTEWIDKRSIRKTGVQVRALLRPSIKPNALIEVASPSQTNQIGVDLTKKTVDIGSANGSYVVKNVTFIGDNRGGDMTMVIDGVRFES